MAESLEYERVADIVERQIESGALSLHERAPSLRKMSHHAGVSIGTVVRAYEMLEGRGLLEARPRSGYFVARGNLALTSPPSSRRVRSRRPRGVAREVIDTVLESFARNDLVAMNSAVASSAGRINGRLNAITRRVLRETPELPSVMSVPPGHEALRREIAKRLVLTGMDVDHDDVVITHGTMEALTLSLGILCQSGDTVLVESPTYFGILQLLQHLGLKVIEVANRPDGGIDVAALDHLTRGTKISAALLQSSFNNPTGAATPDDAKRRIVALLDDAGIPLIEDDIYGALHFGDERPKPFAAHSASGNCITCGSMSKSVAIGYRLGWAVSSRYAAALSRAKFCSSVGNPTLQQHVAARYFAGGGHDRHVRIVRASLAASCRRLARTVLELFPDGTRVSNPAGGVVLWVELPGSVDGLELFHAALARQIGIAPGVIFSAKADYRNFIRLSAGVEWTPAVEDALQRLAGLACDAVR